MFKMFFTSFSKSASHTHVHLCLVCLEGPWFTVNMLEVLLRIHFSAEGVKKMVRLHSNVATTDQIPSLKALVKTFFCVLAAYQLIDLKARMFSDKWKMVWTEQSSDVKETLIKRPTCLNKLYQIIYHLHHYQTNDCVIWLCLAKQDAHGHDCRQLIFFISHA